MSIAVKSQWKVQGLDKSKATKVMASNAPLIGLVGPIKYHCLALGIFGALSRSSYMRCISVSTSPEIQEFSGIWGVFKDIILKNRESK